MLRNPTRHGRVQKQKHEEWGPPAVLDPHQLVDSTKDGDTNDGSTKSASRNIPTMRGGCRSRCFQLCLKPFVACTGAT